MLALHRLPVFAVGQRAGVIVSNDAGVDEFREDGALGAEDRVESLDGHVCLIGDRRHGRGCVAVAHEQRLSGGVHAASIRQRFSFATA